MKLTFMRVSIITLLLILLAPAQSYSMEANDKDKCKLCMADSNYLEKIDEKCAEHGPGWFARGFQLVGQHCDSPTCSYTFSVLCSKEITYPSWPPDLLFDNEYDAVYTYAHHCDECAGAN